MIANSKFLNQPPEFWANVKLIGQGIGYTDRKTSQIKVPTLDEISNLFDKLGLNSCRISKSSKITNFGISIINYFKYRKKLLETKVEPYLLDKSLAKFCFSELKRNLAPNCPLPMNKQKGTKKAPAYLTCIVNMLIEHNSTGFDCDYDPRILTSFTKKKFPVRSLSRRIDGAFPSAVNPIAIWEIKEYYYTTTFGSRVADGVYETLLDGYELLEIRKVLGRPIFHYLIIDDYYTWWSCGRSYLCRICDMLHMGLVSEVLIGLEVLERIPKIVKEWKKLLRQI